MLFDLKAFDVDVGYCEGDETHDCYDTDGSLHIEAATKGVACYHKNADCAYDEEQQHYVAVDAVK